MQARARRICSVRRPRALDTRCIREVSINRWQKRSSAGGQALPQGHPQHPELGQDLAREAGPQGAQSCSPPTRRALGTDTGPSESGILLQFGSFYPEKQPSALLTPQMLSGRRTYPVRCALNHTR